MLFALRGFDFGNKSLDEGCMDTWSMVRVAFNSKRGGSVLVIVVIRQGALSTSAIFVSRLTYVTYS